MTKKTTTVIESTKGWRFVNLKELWRYRDLLYFLVLRDIQVKYKQTVLGALWALIQPFFTMLVFTFFFGKLAKIPSDGIPHPLFYYAGLVPWIYFAGSLSNSGQSLVSNANLVTKVYFPRVILPLTSSLSLLVDFVISMALLFLMMSWFGVYPGASIMVLPLLVLMMIFASTGVGMWLTALNIKYRDVQYTIQFIVQFWMFASPVAYPYSMVPDKYKLIYAMNPMVGVIEGFRSVLVGNGSISWGLVSISFAASLFLFLSGLIYFGSVERHFADVA